MVIRRPLEGSERGGDAALSLIISSVEANAIWMVGDTTVTGGTIGLRDREFMPKILVGKTFPALIAFAGGAEHGSAIAERAAAAATAEEALTLLAGESAAAEVQFAYAALDRGQVRLHKVENGHASECSTLHIGSTEAFAVFQRIRHGDVNPYPPKAFKNFLSSTSGSMPVPEGLSTAIGSMIDLFAMRTDRDVGGWAVPYVLTEDGVSFCSYSYSVSDPMFDQLVPGSLIGHGTPEGGGSTLSVTGLPNNMGLVVYWLQLPGGLVLTRSENGYDQRAFRGGPSAFKAAVREALSFDVDLWVGDQPLGPPRHIVVMRGKDGQLDATIADHGNGLTFAVHNTRDPFGHAPTLVRGIEDLLGLPAGVEIEKISNETVRLRVGAEEVSLDAEGLDSLLRRLAHVRADVRPEVPADLVNGKSSVLAQVDPAWRTYPSLHPGTPEVALNFRHSGYGWLGFLLPGGGALNLGRWLVDYVETHGQPLKPR
jgi:hypothetical protein